MTCNPLFQSTVDRTDLELIMLKLRENRDQTKGNQFDMNLRETKFLLKKWAIIQSKINIKVYHMRLDFLIGVAGLSPGVTCSITSGGLPTSNPTVSFAHLVVSVARLIAK